MVTNGRVIHMMGHAPRPWCLCFHKRSVQIKASKHSSLLGGRFRIEGAAGRGVQEAESRPWPKPTHSTGSLEPRGRGVIYALPRLASPEVT